MDIIIIKKIFEEYGLIASILFVLVITFAKNIEMTKIVKFIKGVLSKRQNESGKYLPRNILNSKLAYWIDYKIPSLVLEEKGRNLVFHDLLKIKFETYLENLTNIEDGDKFTSLSKLDVYNAFVACIRSIDEEYKKRARNEGIPEIVIHKYDIWHSSSLEFVLHSAETMTTSSVYKTNHEYINGIYSLITVLLELKIIEAEHTLTKLNGELTGIKYKDIVIG